MPTATGPNRRVPSATHWGHFEVEVCDGDIVAVHPSKHDPDPSPILQSIPDTLRHPTRIEAPMIRSGYLKQGPGQTNELRGNDRFVPVAWDHALDLLATELDRVKSAYGNESIYAGSYGWASAGRFHHAQSQAHRFLNLFGGYTYSVDTYSTAALTVLLPHIVGRKEYIWANCTSWSSVADHSDLIVMFGGVPLKNGQVHPGGSGKHVVREALERCRERGIEFVNLSPLRDDAARFLDAQWLALRPNTDTAVMLGLAHTIVSMGAHHKAFLDSHCVGFSQFQAYLLGETDGIPKDAQWAASISGIAADQIQHLAERMTEGRTFIILSWSIQRSHHGEQSYWAATALAALLGQIGLPGGGFGFGYGAVGGMGNPAIDLPLPTFPQGQNAVETYIPVARITDLLTKPGDSIDYNGKRLRLPPIHLVYWCGGNPFHHHQDLNRLLCAWKRPDTIVIQDPWWTPAARHADIVLPATSPLERNDIAVARQDPYMTAMCQAVEPVNQARNDYDIFSALATRLGFEAEFTEGRDEMAWLRHMYDVARQQIAGKGIIMPAFDEFWETGEFRFPDPTEQPVLFKDFRQDPVGHPLTTPSGKVELYSETIAGFDYDDCPGHPAWLEPLEWLGSSKVDRYPLHLISNQPRTRLHSQHDPGATSAGSKIQGREPMRMNPVDAASRGISEGDVVRIFNDRGACLAGALVTEDVRQNVVELSTGAWYDPLKPGQDKTLCVHGNPNVLTSRHRHLQARTGTERPHRFGRGRAVYRSATAHPCVRAATHRTLVKAYAPSPLWAPITLTLALSLKGEGTEFASNSRSAGLSISSAWFARCR